MASSAYISCSASISPIAEACQCAFRTSRIWSSCTNCLQLRPRRLFVGLRGIPLPYPLDGMREELCLAVADAMARFAAEQVLVLVALGLQHLGHAAIGLHPVVH